MRKFSNRQSYCVSSRAAPHASVNLLRNRKNTVYFNISAENYLRGAGEDIGKLEIKKVTLL